jgi:hypothetical protein
LKWTDDEGYIVTRIGTNIMPGTIFKTEEDARKVIDMLERGWESLKRRA